MFHEVTVKFKVNWQKNKEDAEIVAQRVIEYIKDHENAGIVFIEKPELVNVEEVGIDCSTCKYCYGEEVCIGDRGEGIEWHVKHLCEHTGEEISPLLIDFCDYYTKREDSEC